MSVAHNRVAKRAQFWFVFVVMDEYLAHSTAGPSPATSFFEVISEQAVKSWRSSPGCLGAAGILAHVVASCRLLATTT